MNYTLFGTRTKGMNRRMKKQRWRVLLFFKPKSYLMGKILTRKRYRKWIRVHRKPSPVNLPPIHAVESNIAPPRSGRLDFLT